MLKANRSTQINGNSVIQSKEGDVTIDRMAMYFSATLSVADGTLNTSMSVQNLELYEKNREQCRADEDEFKALVRAVEDELKQEVVR